MEELTKKTGTLAHAWPSWQGKKKKTYFKNKEKMNISTDQETFQKNNVFINIEKCRCSGQLSKKV